jgi:hypothetical protein
MAHPERYTVLDKTAENLENWCSGRGIGFLDAQAETAYKRRTRRIADVIQLKIPDRVPVVPSFGMFPYLDNGLTCEEAVFDYEKASAAVMKTLDEFKPDMFLGSSYAFPAPMFEALGYRQLRWPGREVSPRHVYQFVEGEYVTAGEFYDHYLADPSDFMLRRYLPRVCDRLKPLERIRPFAESFGYYLTMCGSYAYFGIPEVQEALKALMKAGEESLRWVKTLGRQARKILSYGYPLYEGGESAAPYDLVGDWFRSATGVMIDMYQRPEKLLAVMDKMVPIAIKMGLDSARDTSHPIIGFMLHKGADGFMSPEQFRTFYWPPLRKVMIGLIEEGFVPMLFCEGSYTSRLETIADIPPGKCIYWFETVDWRRAKVILGDRVCIRGGVPASTLIAGTTQQIKDCLKKLIDVVGRGGGLIVDCSLWFDEARHENVKTMIEFTREYGVYR